LLILGCGGGWSELDRGSPPPVRPRASPSESESGRDAEFLPVSFSAADLDREPPDSALAPSADLGEEVDVWRIVGWMGRERRGEERRAPRRRREVVRRCIVLMVVGEMKWSDWKRNGSLLGCTLVLLARVWLRY
jgi:hypothetical protein